MAVNLLRAYTAFNNVGFLFGAFRSGILASPLANSTNAIAGGTFKTFVDQMAQAMGLNKPLILIKSDIDEPLGCGNSLLPGRAGLLIPERVVEPERGLSARYTPTEGAAKFMIARQVSMIKNNTHLTTKIIPLIIGIAAFGLLTAAYPIGACFASIIAANLGSFISIRISNQRADAEALKHVSQEVKLAAKKMFENAAFHKAEGSVLYVSGIQRVMATISSLCHQSFAQRIALIEQSLAAQPPANEANPNAQAAPA